MPFLIECLCQFLQGLHFVAVNFFLLLSKSRRFWLTANLQEETVNFVCFSNCPSLTRRPSGPGRGVLDPRRGRGGLLPAAHAGGGGRAALHVLVSHNFVRN